MRENDERFVKAFGEWLRVLRKRLGMTQVDLGRVLRVRNEPLSRWESGTQTPTAHYALRLLALATPQEREAILERAALDMEDAIMDELRGNRTAARCSKCDRPLRVRMYTALGWPAPPLEREAGSPYAVKICPTCQIAHTQQRR